MKNNLMEIRGKKGYNQKQLANILGISQQTLSSWETGRTTPKPFQMQHMEDLFGVKKEEIFFEAFDYKKKKL